METKVTFNEARNSVIEFFNNEFKNFDPLLLSHFLNRYNDFLNYTEEGRSFRPKIIFTNNIETLVKQIDKSYMIPMFDDENASNFNNRLKPIIALASSDWCVYIDIKENKISYGLIKVLNSIKDKDLFSLIETNESLKEKDKFSCIMMQCDSFYVMTLTSIKGNKLTTNFSLDPNKKVNDINDINEFVDDSFSKLRTTSKKLNDIKTMYSHIIKRVISEINGTICVVVDKDYVDNGLFDDGIWLKTPISFSKLFTSAKSYSEEKLQAFVQLFIGMLSADGITIVDNLGRIRAYNIFIELNNKRTNNIVGGARKRTVYTIMNSKRPHIMGVYFQSHDGEIFYHSMKKTKKKKPTSPNIQIANSNNLPSISKEINENKNFVEEQNNNETNL